MPDDAALPLDDAGLEEFREAFADSDGIINPHWLNDALPRLLVRLDAAEAARDEAVARAGELEALLRQAAYILREHVDGELPFPGDEVQGVLDAARRALGGGPPAG